MKKILLLLLLLPFSIFGQKKTASTPLEKMKGAIKTYLYENMNDFNSYQPVSFSPIQEVQVDFSAMPESLTLTKQMVTLMRKAKPYTDQMEYLKKLWGEKSIENNKEYLSNVDSAKKYRGLADSIKSIAENKIRLYNSLETEYKVTHKFRGKNTFGAYILNNYEFTFNHSYQITNVINLAKTE
jgi:hypothetical protein